jgi:hypothetical protein
VTSGKGAVAATGDVSRDWENEIDALFGDGEKN